MAKVYESLDDRLCEFIRSQKMFFVASAPLAGDGRINLSPKGFDTFRILGPTTVAYLDFTGSGVESIAHVKENGRFVIMFCSFDKQPLILRLHGRGSVLERSDPGFEELIRHFDDQRLARAIIKLDVDRICDSCGWGVPMYEYVGKRDQFAKWDAKKGEEGLRKAQLDWNMASLDGLPGLNQPSV